MALCSLHESVQIIFDMFAVDSTSPPSRILALYLVMGIVVFVDIVASAGGGWYQLIVIMCLSFRVCNCRSILVCVCSERAQFSALWHR